MIDFVSSCPFEIGVANWGHENGSSSNLRCWNRLACSLLSGKRMPSGNDSGKTKDAPFGNEVPRNLVPAEPIYFKQ